MLRARLKTTGVVEHKFTLTKSTEFRGVDWVIYDVGGARNQRQAWAPYFDDGASAALLYSISLSRHISACSSNRMCSERDYLPRADQRVRPGPR